MISSIHRKYGTVYFSTWARYEKTWINHGEIYVVPFTLFWNNTTHQKDNYKTPLTHGNFENILRNFYLYPTPIIPVKKYCCFKETFILSLPTSKQYITTLFFLRFFQKTPRRFLFSSKYYQEQFLLFKFMIFVMKSLYKGCQPNLRSSRTASYISSIRSVHKFLWIFKQYK